MDGSGGEARCPRSSVLTDWGAFSTHSDGWCMPLHTKACFFSEERGRNTDEGPNFWLLDGRNSFLFNEELTIVLSLFSKGYHILSSFSDFCEVLLVTCLPSLPFILTWALEEADLSLNPTPAIYWEGTDYHSKSWFPVYNLGILDL